VGVSKHIKRAIKYAKRHGWTETSSRGHPYCVLWGPDGESIIRVSGTPRVPENEERRIRRVVDAVAEAMAEERARRAADDAGVVDESSADAERE
jgi:hypothetical protein